MKRLKRVWESMTETQWQEGYDMGIQAANRIQEMKLGKAQAERTQLIERLRQALDENSVKEFSSEELQLGYNLAAAVVTAEIDRG